MLSLLVPKPAQDRIRQFVDRVLLPQAVLIRPGSHSALPVGYPPAPFQGSRPIGDPPEPLRGAG